MSFLASKKDVKDDMANNLIATPQTVAEEVDVSKAVAASMDYAQALPSQVNDHANWVPQSHEDWDIFKRQGAAIGEARACKEDPDLQAAIKSSLEQHKIDQAKEKDQQGGRPLNGKDVSTDKGKSPHVSFLVETPARPSLEDRIHHLSLKVHSEPYALYDPHGDTYVYLDPPTQQPEQDDATYSQCTERYKNPMLMQKQTLLSFNSPFFEQMFGPTNQFRILRRRGLVGNLPDHVKHVIDLTPPAEGDDAVYLMTELYCSEGVRKWFLANQRWKVSKSLVGGEDEYMSPIQGSNRFTANVSTSGAWTDGVGYEASPGFLNSQGMLVPLPLEYSPVRHRFAIERVLNAMQGIDPQLDSAPKVWTTFAVAKYFSITHSPLTDYIVRWLRASPNSYFLEVNPEISLKIADGLQCHDLCRDVFAILVGEEALDTTRRYSYRPFGTQASVHGRKREDLLESYQTRIEYASKSFIEHVAAKFSSLVDDDMTWIESIPEYSKLVFDSPLPVESTNQLFDVRSVLKSYVRGAICKLLSTNFTKMPDADQALFANDHLFPNTPWASVWKTLLPRERLLTRSFWDALRLSYIFPGPTNLDIEHGWDKFSPTAETTDFEVMSPNNEIVKIVHMQDVRDMVATLNYWLFNVLLDPTADEKSKSGSDHGEIMRTRSTDGLVPRASSDCMSSPPRDYVFEDGLGNALTENCLPIQEEPRSVADSAQLNQRNWNYDSQARLPSQSRANEADEKPFFDLQKFFAQAMNYLRSFATQMLEPPDYSMRVQSLELRLTNTLVSLTDAEWKYLPLWAGGNDDGTGGVFNDDIPLSSEGFSIAGPNVHTGSEGSRASSEATFGVRSLNTITNTSLRTNNGSSDMLPQGKVVSADAGSFPSGDETSMLDGEKPSSDKSIVLVPSVNGSSITLDSDRTVITWSEYESDQGDKGKGKSSLNAKVSSEVEALDDIFAFDGDDDSDTMDGEYDDEEDEGDEEMTVYS